MTDTDQQQPAPLTPAELAAIRERTDAATDGPWGTWPDGTEESVESLSLGRFVCHLNSNMRQFREDAAFIAHARQDVPRLLASVEHWRALAEAACDEVRRLTEAGAANPCERCDNLQARLVASERAREALVRAVEDYLADSTPCSATPDGVRAGRAARDVIRGLLAAQQPARDGSGE